MPGVSARPALVPAAGDDGLAFGGQASLIEALGHPFAEAGTRPPSLPSGIAPISSYICRTSRTFSAGREAMVDAISRARSIRPSWGTTSATRPHS